MDYKGNGPLTPREGDTHRIPQEPRELLEKAKLIYLKTFKAIIQFV
jgi:hypothetical protein